MEPHNELIASGPTGALPVSATSAVAVDKNSPTAPEANDMPVLGEPAPATTLAGLEIFDCVAESTHATGNVGDHCALDPSEAATVVFVDCVAEVLLTGVKPTPRPNRRARQLAQSGQQTATGNDAEA